MVSCIHKITKLQIKYSLAMIPMMQKLSILYPLKKGKKWIFIFRREMNDTVVYFRIYFYPLGFSLILYFILIVNFFKKL